jgi:hypothetical protein
MFHDTLELDPFEIKCQLRWLTCDDKFEDVMPGYIRHDSAVIGDTKIVSMVLDGVNE